MALDIDKKLNRYFYAFSRIDFEGQLLELEEKVDQALALAGGGVGVSVGTSEIEDDAVTSPKVSQAIRDSLALADSSLQAIAPASISTTELDAGVNASLVNADSALQASVAVSVPPASTSIDVNATFDDTEVEGHLIALANKINVVLNELKTAGLMAT